MDHITRFARREVLIGAGASILTGAANCLRAEEAKSIYPETIMSDEPPEDSKDADYSGAWSDILPFGTSPPDAVEIQMAKNILSSAKGKTAVEVAECFLILSEEKQKYIGGWPDRWNPVIVEFFKATRTHPTGDVTPWCAAFVNWCLQRSGAKFITNNASSGSFRTWGKKTETPKKGDIAVFGRTDQTQYLLGRGHVGFYIDQDQARILILGGNQVTKNGHHRISLAWFKKDGTFLRIHSVRKVYAA
jgi:uncharacterized protein (TIGR02594 family)